MVFREVLEDVSVKKISFTIGINSPTKKRKHGSLINLASILPDRYQDFVYQR